MIELKPILPDDEKVLYFLMDNNFFGVEPVLSCNKVYVSEEGAKIILSRLETFVAHQDDTCKEKVIFLSKTLENTFPITASRLAVFCNEVMLLPVTTEYRMYDYLVFALKKEAHAMTGKELTSLIEGMSSSTTLEATKNTSLYFKWARDRYSDAAYAVDVLPPERRYTALNQAYELSSFISIYYELFNEDAISENDLISKACSCKTSAYAWAYLSIRCVCALRDTDLLRFPHPSLPGSPEKVLENIQHGIYTTEVYVAAVEQIKNYMEVIPMKPNKTKEHPYVPDACLAIPYDLLAHFGVVFLICEAHNQLEGLQDAPLFRPVKTYEQIKRYLGEATGELFRERNASAIAFSKTFLQILEFYGNTSSPDPGFVFMLGYRLASRARAHVTGGRHDFASTTIVYLRNGIMSLSDPVVAMSILNSRGALSCVLSMFLNTLTCGEYMNLDFSQKTLLMNELGLSPLEVERATEIFLKARETSLQEFQKIIRASAVSEEARKDAVFAAIHRIGTWKAPGKEDGVLCFMTAMNQTCANPSFSNCIACPYRVDTKYTFYRIVAEYNRLDRLVHEARTPGERKKCDLLAKAYLFPLIQQALQAADELYGPEMVKQLNRILNQAWKR